MGRESENCNTKLKAKASIMHLKEGMWHQTINQQVGEDDKLAD